MTETPKVVLHLDEAGDFIVLLTPGVRVFTIDERCPGDRVYEHMSRCTMSEVDALIGDDKIGNSLDGKSTPLLKAMKQIN